MKPLTCQYCETPAGVKVYVLESYTRGATEPTREALVLCGECVNPEVPPPSSPSSVVLVVEELTPAKR